MVHALEEAHRVLKPDSLLLDLRPAAEHRRIGIETNGRYEEVAVMQEKLDDDYAANRAVNTAIQRGLFKQVSRRQFNCTRVMLLKDLGDWVKDFSDDPHSREKRLRQKVEQAYRSRQGRKLIVANGPLVLRLLRVLKG